MDYISDTNHFLLAKFKLLIKQSNIRQIQILRIKNIDNVIFSNT